MTPKTKVCGACKKRKKLKQFSSQNSGKYGVLWHCKKCHAAYELVRQRKKRNDPEWRKHVNRTSRVNYRKRRNKLYERLGGAKCACCGETKWQFLQIDHVNNDGVKDRQKTGLKAEYWKAELQVLCANCNWGKRYGRCPHKKGGDQ